MDRLFFCFRAAEQLTNAKVPHVLAAVDATQERDLANRYQYHFYSFMAAFSLIESVRLPVTGRLTYFANKLIKYEALRYFFQVNFSMCKNNLPPNHVL